MDLDDPNFERTPYTEFGAYGRSKTANVLCAVEFDRRHRARAVRATAVHPGGIQTELGRHMTPEVMQKMMDRVKSQPGQYKFKTVPQGAATSIWAGVIADVNEAGGKFCEDCHVAETINDPERMAGVRPYAQDSAHADELWAKSEEWVGEKFPLA